MTKRSNIVLFLLFMFSFGGVMEVKAQSKILDYFRNNSRGAWQGSGKNKEEFDDNKVIYIGMSPFTHLSYSHYFIEKSKDWNTIPVAMPVAENSPDQFASISNPGGLEIGFGLPIRIRINHYLSFSTGVFFSIERGRYTKNSVYGPRINYTFSNDKDEKHIRMQRGDNDGGENFSTIELPLLFKLYSDYKYFSQKSEYPYRIYLLGGSKLIRNFGSNEYYNQTKNFTGSKIDPPLIFKNRQFNIDTGLGLDIHSKYSKFSFEARYSQSLGDLLNKKHKNYISSPNPYMSVIDKLSIRGIQFSIIIE